MNDIGGAIQEARAKGNFASLSLLADCMDVMANMPDKSVPLAIVDPPYGIGAVKTYTGKKAKPTKYTVKDWDDAPAPKEFFAELMRVSVNQIIWGANHFISRIPYDSSCWIVWDKENGGADFADCELAWTSFTSATRMCRFRWNGMLQGDMSNKEVRIHPTQKPVYLYRWLLSRYAKPGDVILDTHLGSGSSRIAAWKEQCHFIGIEIDSEYFQKQEERFNKVLQASMSQNSLFK